MARRDVNFRDESKNTFWRSKAVDDRLRAVINCDGTEAHSVTLCFHHHGNELFDSKSADCANCTKLVSIKKQQQQQ
jgi:hypothetical protein